MKQEFANRFEVSPAHRRGLTAIGISIACLWYLDMLTTLWALENGAMELGPFAKWLMSYGIGGLLIGKTLGLVLIMALAWRMASQGHVRAVFWGLAFIGALSLGVVVWNLFSILLLTQPSAP